jgi:hypothetical protein
VEVYTQELDPKPEGSLFDDGGNSIRYLRFIFGQSDPHLHGRLEYLLPDVRGGQIGIGTDQKESAPSLD